MSVIRITTFWMGLLCLLVSAPPAYSDSSTSYLSKGKNWTFRAYGWRDGGTVRETKRLSDRRLRVRLRKVPSVRNLIVKFGKGLPVVTLEVESRGKWQECTGALAHNGRSMSGTCSNGRWVEAWSAETTNDAKVTKLRRENQRLRQDLEMAKRRERRGTAGTVDIRRAGQGTSDALNGEFRCPKNMDCSKFDGVSYVRAPRISDRDGWVDALLKLQNQTVYNLSNERGAELARRSARDVCRGKPILCRVGVMQQIINNATMQLRQR